MDELTLARSDAYRTLFCTLLHGMDLWEIAHKQHQIHGYLGSISMRMITSPVWWNTQDIMLGSDSEILCDLASLVEHGSNSNSVFPGPDPLIELAMEVRELRRRLCAQTRFIQHLDKEGGHRFE